MLLKKLSVYFCLIFCSIGGFAQVAFPNKPLTIIVPYLGGSGSDAQARLFADQLSRVVPYPVVVENKPGANGSIGMRALRAAPADGHTLVVGGGSTMIINPLLTKSLGYDPNDFTHVSGIAKAYAGYVVGANSPYRTLEAALASAAKESRPLNIGTYAAVYELGVLWLGGISKTQVQNVSYKGGAPILTDLIGGHLEMGFVELSAAAPLAREGKLRILALSSEARTQDYPGVPLVAEIFPGYELAPWTSFLVRSETPAPVVTKLSVLLREVFKSDAAREYYSKNGLSPLNLDEQQMKKRQDAESASFKSIAAAAKISPQ